MEFQYLLAVMSVHSTFGLRHLHLGKMCLELKLWNARLNPRLNPKSFCYIMFIRHFFEVEQQPWGCRKPQMQNLEPFTASTL